MTQTSKSDKIPLMKDKTPKLNYTKHYDQVSWRSADTDFEVNPSVNADEQVNVKAGKCTQFCSRRKRKFTALIVVVFVFLIIMSGLIYLYYSKSSDTGYVLTSAVMTDCGKITGIVETLVANNKEVETYAFKGIPYAKPPVNELRWREPNALSKVPSQCWTGEYAATSFGNQCAQRMGNLTTTNEDCLYLNVFTPTLDENKNLPVFVWIHGGSLIIGNGSDLGYSPDKEFVHSMGVVAVSMNYRLNAFGFLTLEELWVPGESYGNYGLMDQILALKWVQKNIKNFGGDPNLVTICGQSSGGTSIFGLLASPMADGLFHRAIPMSGSPKFEKSYVDASSENRVFINQTICKSLVSAGEIKQCLYNLSAAEVLNAIPYDTYPNWSMEDLLDFPTKGLLDGALAVVDPVVIQRPPKELSLCKFRGEKKVSILVGSTAQEIGLYPINDFIDKPLSQYRAYLKERLDAFSPAHISIVLDDLYHNISVDYKPEYLHETISSDVRVNCPSNVLTKDFQSSKHHTVYRYVVEEMPSHPINIFGFPARHAFHMWDAYALFNFKVVKMLGYIPSSYDLQFKKSLSDNLKHFMMYGHPANSDWSSGKTGVFKQNGYVDILSGDYHEKQCSFWNDVRNGYVSYAWIN